MLLTLDIGNTNIKSGLFANDELKNFTVHPSIEAVIKFINQSEFDEIALCSVNPQNEKFITANITVKTKRIFQSNIHNKFNLVINYKTPSTLGMDRVCSAVGALNLAGQNRKISGKHFLVTIDFGTATTINIVSPKEEFVGGLIAPGITTMLKSLNDNTEQLPLPDIKSNYNIVGDSTDNSILSGVFTATVGMINETIKFLEAKSGYLPHLFITGGNSKFILPHLKYNYNFDEALVLRGLKVIYDLNS